MGSPLLDLFESSLEIVHCPATSRTSNILRFVETSAGCLKKFILKILSKTGFRYRDSGSILVVIFAGNVHLVNFLVKQTLAEVT